MVSDLNGSAARSPKERAAHHEPAVRPFPEAHNCSPRSALCERVSYLSSPPIFA